LKGATANSEKTAAKSTEYSAETADGIFYNNEPFCEMVIAHGVPIDDDIPRMQTSKTQGYSSAALTGLGRPLVQATKLPVYPLNVEGNRRPAWRHKVDGSNVYTWIGL
jgi:hypothetical protein